MRIVIQNSVKMAIFFEKLQKWPSGWGLRRRTPSNLCYSSISHVCSASLSKWNSFLRKKTNVLLKHPLLSTILVALWYLQIKKIWIFLSDLILQQLECNDGRKESYRFSWDKLVATLVALYTLTNWMENWKIKSIKTFPAGGFSAYGAIIYTSCA